MKNMKSKGFTLMELLAVIVVLAIISVITVPIVIGVIDRARMASYEESVRSIFEATNIYIASADFAKFPSEGISVTDPAVKIKNKNFTSGKILKNEEGKLELDKISDGRYCAGGTYENVVVIEGSCDQLDVTPPTVTLTSNLVTSNSITIVATGEDLESGINGYEFSKDNGSTWTSKQTSNVYTFTNLTNNKDYTFKVRAINNNQLSTISDSITVKTNDVTIPTYSISTTDWVATATVTITYPARETGYVYQYSLDSAATWITVAAPATTQDIVFTDNGSVIARIFDGANEISGTSYTVANIDKLTPTVEITVVGTPFNAGGWAKANFTMNVLGIDDESGIKSYTYCQTTSATCTPSTVVNAVSGTVTVSTESTTNKVCAFSTDNANNNSSVVCSSNYKLDKTIPSVAFGTNGNATYAKTRSTTVTVNDTSSGVLASSLKYLWNTSTTAPAEATFSTTFTSGGTLSTPVGVDGGYYLWILGKDNAGNTNIIRSNVFNIDNTIPAITVTGSNPATVVLGGTYTDAGATASDNTGGNITASIVKTGTVNTAAVGTYTLTYNVSDASGNAATAKTRTVNVIPAVYTFTNAGATGNVGPTQTQINTTYTATSLDGKVTSSGGIQSWTVPYTGTYRILVKGAKGGNGNNAGDATAGGNGASMQGNFTLTAGQVLKILVGQMGTSSSSSDTGGGGGGGTFVALSTNTALIVAGGGGGGGDNATAASGGTTGTAGLVGNGTGGAGGTGGNGGTNVGTAGGGGGFTGNGLDTTYGGKSFINGGLGASGTYGIGGFGGGAGTSDSTNDNGAGGGGYSGGGAGGANAGAGGGGSYNSGTSPVNTANANTTHGSVVITIIP